MSAVDKILGLGSLEEGTSRKVHIRIKQHLKESCAYDMLSEKKLLLKHAHFRVTTV